MQEPWENRFCSLLLFEVREINRFLESCHRDPRKILRASRYSILETRASNLDTRFSIASRIEDRVSSRDCQLTFARYCIKGNSLKLFYSREFLHLLDDQHLHMHKAVHLREKAADMDSELFFVALCRLQAECGLFVDSNPLTLNFKEQILLSCPHTRLLKVLGRSY